MSQNDHGPAKGQAAERPAGPTPSRRHGRARLGAAAVLTVLLIGGCSGTATAQKTGHETSAATGSPTLTGPSGSGAACTKLPASDIPGAAGTLTQADTGTYCLTVGQRLDVFLTVPGGPGSKGPRWSPAASSDRAVLAPRTSGILTAPVGVTPGVFQALAPGTVTLTSRLTPGQAWKVTLDVTAP